MHIFGWKKKRTLKYFTLILFVCPLNLLEAGRHFVLPPLTMAVSPLNDSTLNGLVKTLEMAVKPYKTAPPNKLGPLFLSHHPASPSRWPHRRAECCVQPLESHLLLVPHRRSGGGPLQTARVGLRGGGGGCGWCGGGGGGGGVPPDSQWQGERSYLSGQGAAPREPEDTHGCNPLQLAAETPSEGM